MGRTRSRGVAQSWMELDLRLRLLGCEERRRPVLRAFRDRVRPRVYDRHLVRPSGDPEDAAQDVRALDEFYRETAAAQWSFLDLEGARSDKWEVALASLGLLPERFVLMEGDTADGAIAEGVVTLEGPERFRRLERLQLDLAQGSPVASVVHDLVSLLEGLVAAGHSPQILAFEERRELVAYLVYTVVDGRSWMEDLETRVDRRGQGIARALLRAASIASYRGGARATGFTADESDWPWQWYRREGFRPIGRYVRLRRLL